ncbi:Hypothetical protein mma_3165 [Janthinobacterium sp. Marseille]|nr:GNAT family N-acetyltransferase [Janthinobacterium sp. Marseille]ABR91853.1 Hypothetical protein mma_3165 [Janthinobacterium sp. Marseille]
MGVEELLLNHPDQRSFKMKVTFSSDHSQATLEASYLEGFLLIPSGSKIAHWNAYYEEPNENDAGHADLGGACIELKIPELRGIGLGSLFMLPLVQWLKNRPEDVPVALIDLVPEDAKTPPDQAIRNRFYEKLGFKFNYGNNNAFGQSQPIRISGLILPPLQLSGGWQIKSKLQIENRIY